jgi:peptidoglycan/LPS O-acetylase OafA/YrhL
VLPVMREVRSDRLRRTAIKENLPEAVRHQRLPTLDGWRAVAITGVLGAHIRWPLPLLSRWFTHGSLGVQLFFALSGFLITTRLLEEYDQNGFVSWRNFYIRRVFRILPPAFLALLTLTFLGLGLHLIPVTGSQLVASAFFYRNYLTGIVGPSWYTAHFWSLAVEEHFYLLWPAILGVVGFARGARTAGILTFAAFAWRVAGGHFDPLYNSHSVYRGFRTDYCIGDLLWGCFLAFVWNSPSARALAVRIVRSYWALGVLAAQALLLHYHPRGSDVLVELLMAFLPFCTVADPSGLVSRILEIGPIAWVGRLSYSLYLWQQLFIPISWAPQTLGIIQMFPFNVVLAFSAASLSYYFVERPSIRLGKQMQNQQGWRIPAKVAVASQL